MRVLIASPYFSPHIGGVENYVLAIAKGLKSKNHEVSILTTQEDQGSVKRELLFNLPVYRLPVSFKVSNTPVHLSWKKISRIIIDEVKPHVVNVHTPVPYFADVVSLAAQQTNVPVVVTYHNDIVKENIILNLVSALYYQVFGKRTLNDSAAIVTTSQSYAQTSPYIKDFTDKVHTIPPGVYPVEKLSKSEYQKPYILFVGKLDKTHKHKGLNYLIESFKHLNVTHPEVTLQIVGKGDDLATYQALVEELGLSQSVEFHNSVDNEDLQKFYQNAICLCLPSISDAEGFGMVVIEAALYGVPAIGSNIGGISQSIVDGETGLLCPPKDSIRLANSLSLLIEDKSLRMRLGKAAKDRVEKNFLWDLQIEKTSRLLDKVKK